MLKLNSLRFLVVSGFLAALASASMANQSLMQRTAFLITSPHVALDLKLSSGQVSKRQDIMLAYDKTRGDVIKRMQAAQSDQYDSYRAELDKLESDTTSQLVGILTPAQQNRLKQIGIQNEGTDALQDDAVASDLGLKAAQRAKIRQVYDASQKAEDDYQAALGEAMSKIPEPGSDDAAVKAYARKQQEVIDSMKPRHKQALAVKAAGDKQILAIMTPAQRTKWAAMHGKPLKPGA